MDEREVANQVLAILDQQAYRVSARRVLAVNLVVGGRRVIDIDRLRPAFRDVSRGTVVERAQLLARVLPVRHHYQLCGCDFEAANRDCPCAQCGHPRTEMRGGEELRLLDMEIDDTAA